jgi:hypothetical protein
MAAWRKLEYFKIFVTLIGMLIELPIRYEEFN